MRVKIYSIKNCRYCNILKEVLKTSVIPFDEVKVRRLVVGEGSVLSMGMYIGQSTKIVNRKTGEITYGKIPPYSVVVPGSLPDKKNTSAPSLYCAVIIKQVDEKTRSKTSINDLLRE